MLVSVSASGLMLSSGRVPGGLMMIASWNWRNPFVPGPLPGTTRGLDVQTLIFLTHVPSGYTVKDSSTQSPHPVSGSACTSS